MSVVEYILGAALNEASVPAAGLGERIRSRFAPLGGVQLAIARRKPVREPPAIEEAAPPANPRAARRVAARPKRRG